MITNRDSEETDITADPDRQLDLDIPALEIVTLHGVVHQNSGQVERLVDKGGKCLEEARALAGLHAPYSDDIMQSLWTASVSIETLVKQIEKVSGVAMVASTWTLDRMSRQIPSNVARSALVNAGTGDRVTS